MPLKSVAAAKNALLTFYCQLCTDITFQNGTPPPPFFLLKFNLHASLYYFPQKKINVNVVKNKECVKVAMELELHTHFEILEMKAVII